MAFQLASEFKREVYRLVENCSAPIDFKYRGELLGAAEDVESDITEGFARNVPGEFAQFLRYALASLAEARCRLRDGIDRRYFTEKQCVRAASLGTRCADVTRALHRSLRPFQRKRSRRRV